MIQSNTEQRSTLIYRCRHVSCTSITHSVESAISATGTVEVSKEQNLITINDINSKIKEITELILALDIESPQVLVEALVIEVRMSEGMEWDAGFKISDDNQSSFGTILGGEPVVFLVLQETIPLLVVLGSTYSIPPMSGSQLIADCVGSRTITKPKFFLPPMSLSVWESLQPYLREPTFRFSMSA